MAEKANQDTSKNPAPAPAVNGVVLGQFVESLKKDKSNTQKANKLEIPSNFLAELKNSTKALETLNIKVADISTNIADAVKSLQSIEKNILAGNKSVAKAIEKVNANILKIKATTQEGIVATPEQKPETVDTAAEALKKVEVQPVKIVDLADEATGKFDKLFSKLNIKGVAETKKAAAGKPLAETSLFEDIAQLFGMVNIKKLFTGKLKDLILEPLKKILFNPATGFIASLGLAISSWFDEGPFKGAKELVGKIGVTTFAKEGLSVLIKKFTEWGTKLLPAVGGELVEKGLGTAIKAGIGKVALTIAKTLGKVLRFVPYLGSIIDLGSGISRMLKGDFVGGLIDFAAAGAGLLDLVFPGLGRALSIAISLINVYRDISGGGVEENAKSDTNVSIKDFIGKAKKWLGDKIKAIYNYFFGKLFRGYEYIKKGDYARGVITIASFTPGLGWLENLYDWLVGPPEKINEKGEKEPAQPGLLSKAWDWMKTKISEKFTSSFRNVKEGWKDFQRGDFARGITTWASIIPGLGWLKDIYKWAFGERVEEHAEFLTPEPGAIEKLWTNVKEGLFDKLKEMQEFITTKIKDALMAPINAVKKGWSKITGWFGDNKDSQNTENALEGVDKIKDNTRGAVAATKTEKVAPKVGQLTTKANYFLIANETVSPDKPLTEMQMRVMSDAIGFGNKYQPWIMQKYYDQLKSQAPQTETEKIQSPLTTLETPPENQIDTIKSSLEAGKTYIPDIKANAPLTTVPTPLAPLDIPTDASVSALKDMKDNLTEVLKAKVASESVEEPQSNAVVTAANSNTNAVANSTNIFSSTLDRDIPYIERNKYRQTLIYNRSLL